MSYRRTTFGKFIIEQGERNGDLAALLNDVQRACKSIAAAVSRGALGAAAATATRVNMHAEEQKPLHLTAKQIMVKTRERGGQLRGMVSEALDQACAIPAGYPRARYHLAFDSR